MKNAPRKKPPVNVASILPDDWIHAVAHDHQRLGLGLDVGTTTNKKSNPSVLALAQKVGHEVRFPLIVRWKSTDPEVAKTIIRAVLAALRTIGLRVRKLCIDATSERYFAVDVRRALAVQVPVQLVVSSENTEYGGEVMLWKVYLGNLLVNLLEDGYGALPSTPWLKTDIRSVVKNKGSFDAEVVEDGGHGDVFDGCKLALHAVETNGGRAQAAGAQVGTFGAKRPVDSSRNLVNPNAGRRGGAARMT